MKMDKLDTNSLESHPVEHVKMVVPVWRRESDFEDILEFGEESNGHKQAALFEPNGINEEGLEKEIRKKTYRILEKIFPKDLSAGGILAIKFNIPVASGSNSQEKRQPIQVAILVKIERVRNTSVYGHVFRWTPLPEGGGCIEKVSNSSKITLPLYSGRVWEEPKFVNRKKVAEGRYREWVRDVTESFVDWIPGVARIQEKHIEEIRLYSAPLEKIGHLVAQVAKSVAKKISR